MSTSPAMTDEIPVPPASTPETRGRFDGFLFTHRGKLAPAFGIGAMFAAAPTTPGIVTGVVAMFASSALRLWAIRHIGGAARVHARKAREGKHLVTTGPFALMRNPLYVANISGLVALCLMLGPVWYAGVAGVVMLAWYAAVVRWEEGVLIDLYGDQYVAYRDVTPALLPSLRRLARGNLGGATIPLAKALRRERGMAVLMVVAIALALTKQMLG
jgi:protein-S-isoprenylcysteine O-methyltransferase Ste14